MFPPFGHHVAMRTVRRFRLPLRAESSHLSCPPRTAAGDCGWAVARAQRDRRQGALGRPVPSSRVRCRGRGGRCACGDCRASRWVRAARPPPLRGCRAGSPFTFPGPRTRLAAPPSPTAGASSTFLWGRPVHGAACGGAGARRPGRPARVLRVQAAAASTLRAAEPREPGA